MKKLLSLLTTLFLVFTVAGTALAFDYGDESSLILSITDGTNYEFGIDLGIEGTDFEWTNTNFTLAEAGSVDFNELDFSSLVAGIYSATSGYTVTWGLAIDSEELSLSTNQLIAMRSAVSTIAKITYGGEDELTAYTEPSGTGSYASLLANGTYGGLLTGTDSSYEVTLDDLNIEDPDSYVDVYMYSFSLLADELDGDYTLGAVIRLYADGSVVLNPVPVPAAVWLLGSGILGLIGLRRRSNAA